MLNLRKKIVLSLDQSNITTDDVNKAIQGDIVKQDEVVTQVMKLVRSAVNSIKNIPEDSREDFEQDTLIHILGNNGRTLGKFNDEISKFSTFIYNIVNNAWKTQYKKLLKEKQETTSLDITTGKNKDVPLGETVEDPKSLQFLHELQGTSLLNIILDSLSEREADVLNLWINSPFVGDERNKEVAEKFNKNHPENQFAPNTVEQFIIRTIRPKVQNLLYGKSRQKVSEPEISETERLQKRIQELDNLINKAKGVQSESTLETPSEKMEEEEYVPPEERAAPVYKINPETGEKTRIARKGALVNQLKFWNSIFVRLSKKL